MIHYRDGNNIKHNAWGSVPCCVSVIRGGLLTGPILLWFYEKYHSFLLHSLLRFCGGLRLCQARARFPWWTPSSRHYHHSFTFRICFEDSAGKAPESPLKSTDALLLLQQPPPLSMPEVAWSHIHQAQGGEEPECSLSSSNTFDATRTSACMKEAELSRLRGPPWLRPHAWTKGTVTNYWAKQIWPQALKT